jgi:pyruvate,orthophosphate dikinase
VRIETEPEDIHGMHAARGILTTRGGMTSHAAVVARGMGQPCVAGAGGDPRRLRRATLTVVGSRSKPATAITRRRRAGRGVHRRGRRPIEPELSGDFATLMALGRCASAA